MSQAHWSLSISHSPMKIEKVPCHPQLMSHEFWQIQ